MPKCKSKKNSKKSYGRQNYCCKECGRQLTGDHALSYKGCHSGLTHRILLMPVRSAGIRDAAAIENVSIGKVLSVLTKSNYVIRPKQTHYDSLEADELWTYAGEKKNKVWLIYAYHYINFGYV